MNTKGLDRLFKFIGFRIEDITFIEHCAQVTLTVDKRRKTICPYCGAKGFIEAEEIRKARDLSLGIARLVYIKYPARKFHCNSCLKRPWLTPIEIDSGKRATKRFMIFAAKLMCSMPARKVAALINVVDTRLRRWDKAILQEHLGEVELNNLRTLLVDEKAIGAGHQYITTVLNGETGELLHVNEGKKKESLKAFFDKLSTAQKATIKVACIDRGGAYLECIKEELPGVDIAFDKFHLVQNLNEVINQIRREEWNRLREENDKEGADLVKGQRFNLLRRPENNTAKQQGWLDRLLDVNKPLSISYMLLEDFRDVLSQPYIHQAESALGFWIRAATESGVEKVAAFAKKMKKAAEGIINAVRYGVSNGMIEGFNNLISRIIHRGCGYQDTEYLTLKLRQASLPDDFKVPISQK
jgi:transposase